MKNIFFALFLTLVLTGCSTGSKKKGTKVGNQEISNEDFIAPRPITYSEGSDFFGDDFDEGGALSRESMASAPADDLDQFDSSDNPLNQALSYCYRKQFNKAEQIFDRYYRRFKKNPAYWNQMGTCYLLKDERRKALLFYNKSRDLKGNYAPPINNLGVIYQLDGKDQKALSAYKKASNLSKFSLTPVFNLGQLYTKYGLLGKARNLFNSLYRVNEEDADVIAALAYVELLSGEYKRAVGYYQKMDKDLYEEPRVGLNLALALYLSDRPKDAKNVLDGIREATTREEEVYSKRVKNFFRGKL